MMATTALPQAKQAAMALAYSTTSTTGAYPTAPSKRRKYEKRQTHIIGFGFAGYCALRQTPPV
jgi:hypothetical protein